LADSRSSSSRTLRALRPAHAGNVRGGEMDVCAKRPPSRSHGILHEKRGMVLSRASAVQRKTKRTRSMRAAQRV
ncbi:hypothetical protein EHQ07_13785, partial [Leptospira gomenensis]